MYEKSLTVFLWTQETTAGFDHILLYGSNRDVGYAGNIR